MKKDKEHTEDLQHIDKQSQEFFKDGKFHWKKSQADVWSELEARMEAPVNSRSSFSYWLLSPWTAAAAIVLMLALTAFLRYYTISVQAAAGEHLSAVLPDHSTISLNAQSTITYHPYWWRIERKVKLSGEAFFEVQKGRKFTVVSEKGITQVVGTSFNILARDEDYKVTCITGIVRVKSSTGTQVLLHPNSKAEVQNNGQIKVLTGIETFPDISWKRNIFYFTASPVLQVFREIERQYDVKINSRIPNNSLYTGNFTKNQKVEEILDLVCPALGLKYSRKISGEYVITEKNE